MNCNVEATNDVSKLAIAKNSHVVLWTMCLGGRCRFRERSVEVSVKLYKNWPTESVMIDE